MTDNYKYCLGLMSGTSLDGVDAALIKTDGHQVLEVGHFATYPYTQELQKKIRDLINGKEDQLVVEKEITLAHAGAVKALLEEAQISPDDVEVIGFHGHTIIHRPEEGFTWQIGDGNWLAELTKIDVVCDFRRRDMTLGGQGAPLVPVYHAALASSLERPVAIVNIGGIANVTWVGEDQSSEIVAFDTGPGNGLINDWVELHTGEQYDKDGQYASQGSIDEQVLARLMDQPFFDRKPPKSLDRFQFSVELLKGLSLEDGAATLTAFTAKTIAHAATFFPKQPKEWLITGGGRHNHFLMGLLAKEITEPVYPVDKIGENGDAMEAQAFAYLAARSKAGLPLTFPSTTGVKQSVTGGAFYRALSV